MQFILASQSQRRQQLLKYLIDDFEVITADINEEELGKLARTPQEMVVGLARAKAKKVWDKVRATARVSPTEQIIILGADTTVIVPEGDRWRSIGKPKDENDAKLTLQSLRNNQHQVYTGICVLVTSRVSATPTIIVDYDISTVIFGDFSGQAIDRYIATGTVMDKAGSYAIQDVGKEFGITVGGSYSNVVGLPIERLTKIFDTQHIRYKPDWEDHFQTKNGKS